MFSWTRASPARHKESTGSSRPEPSIRSNCASPVAASEAKTEKVRRTSTESALLLYLPSWRSFCIVGSSVRTMRSGSAPAAAHAVKTSAARCETESTSSSIKLASVERRPRSLRRLTSAAVDASRVICCAVNDRTCESVWPRPRSANGTDNGSRSTSRPSLPSNARPAREATSGADASSAASIAAKSSGRRVRSSAGERVASASMEGADICGGVERSVGRNPEFCHVASKLRARRSEHLIMASSTESMHMDGRRSSHRCVSSINSVMARLSRVLSPSAVTPHASAMASMPTSA